jgi:hypothetical protein
VEEGEAIARRQILNAEHWENRDMQTARMSDRYVIARDNNVLRVNFERSTDPPNPQFPGAGALRSASVYKVDAAFRRPWFWKERTQAKRLPDNQHASGPIGQRPIRHRGFTMEEEMIRGLSAVLVSGTFMFSVVNAALAGGGTDGFGTDPQDRSLLSTWDKPAFAPDLYRNEVPSVNPRSTTKGPKIDFLFNPQMRIFQPLVAQSAPSTGSERSDIGGTVEHPK